MIETLTETTNDKKFVRNFEDQSDNTYFRSEYTSFTSQDTLCLFKEI